MTTSVQNTTTPQTTPEVERQRLDADIVCVGFGPATAEWLRRTQTHQAAAHTRHGARLRPWLPTILPLPKGEGRGEGKGSGK